LRYFVHTKKNAGNEQAQASERMTREKPSAAMLIGVDNCALLKKLVYGWIFQNTFD
jgi:hypothetical protein